MSSTFDSAMLTITINEDVKLNGHQVGSKVVQAVGSVSEASRRIFSIPTYEVTILALSSSAGAGTYSTDNFRYARITNLDDTNYVRLSFSSGSLNKYDVKLPAKNTFIFTSPSMSGSSTGAAFNSFVNFDSLKATSDTAAVDVELFVASA